MGTLASARFLYALWLFVILVFPLPPVLLQAVRRAWFQATRAALSGKQVPPRRTFLLLWAAAECYLGVSSCCSGQSAGAAPAFARAALGGHRGPLLQLLLLLGAASEYVLLICGTCYPHHPPLLCTVPPVHSTTVVLVHCPHCDARRTTADGTLLRFPTPTTCSNEFVTTITERVIRTSRHSGAPCPPGTSPQSAPSNHRPPGSVTKGCDM